MTYYDVSIKCGDVVGTANGLNVFMKASRVLESLIEQSKARLISECRECTEDVSHDKVLWHDWEITTHDFLHNFSEIEWTWRETGRTMIKEEVNQILASTDSVQISLDEI